MTDRERDNLHADLSAYLDGELRPERAREVEQFLAASAEAGQLLAELRAASDLLHALPRVPSTKDLTAEMARHAEQGAATAGRTARRSWRTLTLAGPLVAAAAVLVICVYVGSRIIEPRATRAPVQRFTAKTEPVEPALAAAPRSAAVATPQTPETPEAPSAEIRSAEPETSEIAAPAGPLADEWPLAAGEPPAAEPVSLAVQPAPPVPPMAEVVVRTQTEHEYAALAAVLTEWGGREADREFTYEFPATDLRARLDELAAGVASRSQVQVQLLLDDSTTDALVRPMLVEAVIEALDGHPDLTEHAAMVAPPPASSTSDAAPPIRAAAEAEEAKPTAAGRGHVPRAPVGETRDETSRAAAPPAREKKSAAPAGAGKGAPTRPAKRDDARRSKDDRGAGPMSASAPASRPSAPQMRVRVQLIPPPPTTSAAPTTNTAGSGGSPVDGATADH